MSSLTRTLQKRIFAAKNISTVPVLCPFAKSGIAGHQYPFDRQQLAITWDGHRVYSAKDPILNPVSRPLVELLENDRRP